jgi:hypothetical protein
MLDWHRWLEYALCLRMAVSLVLSITFGYLTLPSQSQALSSLGYTPTESSLSQSSSKNKQSKNNLQATVPRKW